MEAGGQQLWWQCVRDVLRSDEEPDRPSRRAFLTDAVLAIVLTAVAVVAAVRFPGGDQLGGPQPHLIEPLQLQPAPTPPIDLPPAGPPSASGPWRVGSQVYEAPLLLVVMTALPLAARRRYPLATFWLVLAAALATADGATWITVATCAVAAYSAVAHSRNRLLVVLSSGLAALLAGLAFENVAPGLPTWLGPFVVLLSAGVLASLIRFWQQRLAASRHRLAQLRQAQEEATRRAVEVERSRIAAELHDVVTHNVSVMLIQAGAARTMVDTAPQESKQALLSVEASGRAAMTELRNVMGLLAGPGSAHTADPEDGLEPQPGLDQLDALVDRVRAAGVPVSVAVTPTLGPLPDGVDLAAYRVVQEALTNTIKHAAGAAASVSISQDGEWLEIEVTDTGGTHTVQARTGDGRGLIGLHERLALYGGTLDAARVPGGGYRLCARIPRRTA